MAHAPSDGQIQASHKEAPAGRGKKTGTAPRLSDSGNGAPLSKAASTGVILSLLPQM